MTPADHYERAAELLEAAATAPDPLIAHRLTVRAQVHATLSTVPWGGPDDLTDDVEPATVNDDLAEVLRELSEWSHTAATVPTIRGTITGGNAADYAEGHVDGDESARRTVAALVDPILATLGTPGQ